MRQKWKEWREKSRVFDIIWRIIAFPFLVIYCFLSFILRFSKIILNVLLLILIVCGITGGILYAKLLPM